MSTKMLERENFIKDNGIKRQVTEMALVFNSGQMVPSTRACGAKTKPQVEVE